MKIIADLHIHSYFSRATSKNLNLEYIYKWAKLKGVQIVATGDFIHPEWMKEIEERLEPAEEGLFKLKKEYSTSIEKELFVNSSKIVRFMISGEISCIYKKDEKIRKIHHLITTSNFKSAKKIQNTLNRLGNIRSDGRPIMGIDSRDLLEIVLESDSDSYLIPAHIWTPWFSILGSKSGFDSIEECFEDLSSYIFALETGLSSDPSMNWKVSKLDKYILISNSDAHSPDRLAREANIFDIPLSYRSLFETLKNKDLKKYLGTIEFFPEQGKYHLDGHRKCKIRFDPLETYSHKGICPICNKPLTIGVMNRVESLADRRRPINIFPYHRLISLSEILSEIHGVGVNSKEVQKRYFELLSRLGPELEILLEVPLKDISYFGGDILGEAIKRIREGDIHPLPGYDGEFGIIKIFKEGEKENFNRQISLIEIDISPKKTLKKEIDLPKISKEEKKVSSLKEEEKENIFASLNKEQLEAVRYKGNFLLILAGPGTGKTHTLTNRIAYLIGEKLAEPEDILGITFTNKAAIEMKNRLINLIGEEKTSKMTIKTFHSLGWEIIKKEKEYLNLKEDPEILTPFQKSQILKKIDPENYKSDFGEKISRYKVDLVYPEDMKDKENVDPLFSKIYSDYQKKLIEYNTLDFEDLINLTLKLFKDFPQIKLKYQHKFRWIFVDEYQDLNLAQYKFLRELVSIDKTKLCVIGDPDQAIYGFRGASTKYFQDFKIDFPQAKIVKLNKNYRSGKNILKASTQIMANYRSFQNKEIYSEIEGEKRIYIHEANSDKSEAIYVASEIERLIGGTSFASLDQDYVDGRDKDKDLTFGDIAILYRVSAQSRVIMEAMEKAGIPFQCSGETSLNQRVEVLIILSILKFLLNPEKKIIPELIKMSLSKYGSINFNNLDKLIKHKESFKVGSLIEMIIEELNLNKIFPNVGNIWELLIDLGNSFGNNISLFLEHIILGREIDFYPFKTDKVSLLSLHASKGMEFKVVFLVGCEESLIPYTLENSDLEEERRLFFVGMTRAKIYLYLSYAKNRIIYGKRYKNRASPFLLEIEDSLKSFSKGDIFRKKEEKQLSLFSLK